MIQKTMLILWLISILVFHLLFLTSTRFTLWPEMVVYPYLLNNGFKLYTDIINPYPPFLPLALAFFNKYLGYEPLLIQTLTWSVIIMTDILIFLISNFICKNSKKSLLSLLFFVIFSITFGVNGIWFEVFQTPFIIMSVLFFYEHFKNKKSKYLLLSSAFLAIAFFIKQQALWLVFWFALLLLFKNKNSLKSQIRSLMLLAIPILLSQIFEIFIAFKLGVVKDFFFWSVYFPFLKASSLQGYILLPTPRQALTVLILLLIFIPLMVRKKSKEKLFILTAVVLISFAYPRFDYFHLIPALAVISLAIPKNLEILPSARFSIKMAAIIAVISLIVISIKFITRNWTNEIRFFEGDVYKSSRFIQIINPQNKPVFLQNVPGQILVLSGTLPTKPWADSFPWYLEINGIQEKIIEGIKTEKPQIVIYKPYESRGVFELASYRPQLIANFLDQNYLTFFKINDSLFLRKKQAE